MVFKFILQVASVLRGLEPIIFLRLQCLLQIQELSVPFRLHRTSLVALSSHLVHLAVPRPTFAPNRIPLNIWQPLVSLDFLVHHKFLTLFPKILALPCSWGDRNQRRPLRILQRRLPFHRARHRESWVRVTSILRVCSLLLNQRQRRWQYYWQPPVPSRCCALLTRLWCWLTFLLHWSLLLYFHLLRNHWRHKGFVWLRT